MFWELFALFACAVCIASSGGLLFVLDYYHRENSKLARQIASREKMREREQIEIAQHAIIWAFRESFRAVGRTSPINDCDRAMAQKFLSQIVRDN